MIFDTYTYLNFKYLESIRHASLFSLTHVLFTFFKNISIYIFVYVLSHYFDTIFWFTFYVYIDKMAKRQSTRLNKVSKTANDNDDDDDDFVVDNENPPPLNGEVINKNDHWVTVWSKLKNAGWGWINGDVLSSHYYTKPNIRTTKNTRKGIDYFVQEKHLHKYLETKYNWNPNESVAISSVPNNKKRKIEIKKTKASAPVKRKKRFQLKHPMTPIMIH